MTKNLSVSELLDVYAAVLTDKQRDVIELYYNEDLSLAEIAEHSGITRQGVRDSIKRGEAVMFEMEEKLGLAKKGREAAAAAEEIRRDAKDIIYLNRRAANSAEIGRRAEQILHRADAIDS